MVLAAGIQLRVQEYHKGQESGLNSNQQQVKNSKDLSAQGYDIIQRK